MNDTDQRLFDLMVKHHKLFLRLEAEDIQDYIAGAAEIEFDDDVKDFRLVWGGESWFFHRDGDRPAVIWADGTKEWYKRGSRHRDGDKPAVIYADGAKAWYKHGKLHRDGDKPAVIWVDGDQEWWVKGALIKCS